MSHDPANKAHREAPAPHSGHISPVTIPAPSTNEWSNEGNIDDGGFSTYTSNADMGATKTLDYDLGSIAHTIINSKIAVNKPAGVGQHTIYVYVSEDDITYTQVDTLVRTSAGLSFKYFSFIGAVRYIRFTHFGDSGYAGDARVYELSVMR